MNYQNKWAFEGIDFRAFLTTGPLDYLTVTVSYKLSIIAKLIWVKQSMGRTIFFICYQYERDFTVYYSLNILSILYVYSFFS